MRILLVDDDDVLMDALAKSLVQQRYAVDIATDGAMAEDFVSLFHYDLLVLDVLLPDTDGVLVCQRLRSHGFDRPILMLSARDGGHEKAKALDAGADDYVVKPFNLEELCARIRALLRREGYTAAPILAWGGLMLDPSVCEVTYGQQSIHVTPKEYSLLELFLRHPNRVFSLDTIIENLWSFEDPPGEDAVRTHIKGLRQKLKAGGMTQDLVQTVYGLGYRLRPAKTPTPQVLLPSQPSRPTAFTSEISVAIAHAWEQHQDTIRERVAILEDAAKALSNNQLTYDLQQEGRMNAHKLVGSLGSFGVPEGSRLARELEQLLQVDVPLLPQTAPEISDLVRTLRQEIEHRSSHTAAARANQAEIHQAEAIATLPLLLIVGGEDAITSQLTLIAPSLDLRSAIAPQCDQARHLIQQQRPDVMLLMITEACGPAELAFLTDVAQQSSPIPVIVGIDTADFHTRLTIVQHGASSILHGSTPPHQLLMAAQEALRDANAGAKVLILDDDPHILEFLTITLPSWGFELIPLAHPSQLWETLDELTPDLLVLDIEMPDISGTDICRVLRADPRWKYLPILFLTVHHDPETRYQAFSAGADDFVTKPIVAANLANRMMNRLRRSPRH